MTADPRRVFSQRALWRGSSAAIFALAGSIGSSLFPHLSSPTLSSIHSQPARSRFSASIASFACTKSLCSPAIALPFKSRSSIPFLVAPASSRFSTAPVSEAAYGTRQAHSAAPSLTLRGCGLRSLAASGVRNRILPNSSPGNFFGRRTFGRGWHRFAIPGRVFSNGRSTPGSMGKDMPAPIAGDPEREDPDAAALNDRANAAVDEVGAANSAGNSAASAATEDVTADKGAETAKAGTDESCPQNELWFRVSDSVKLVLQRGDITKWFVDGKRDAIVNAANPRMLGGGGVDGAIHRKAGPELRLACKKIPQVECNVRCPIGEARVTKGFDLPASRVIHTVGPVYHGCDAPADLLGNAYRSTLKLALEERIAYVAFPAISCGIYGYPFNEAAKVALSTISEASEGLAEVHFVFFEQETHDAWSVEASRRFSKM